MVKRTVLIASLLLLVISGTVVWFFKKKVTIDFSVLSDTNNIVPIAVVGSGPAGLSAALYGTRLGFYTVVFEGPKPGGQLTETGYVENWPGVGRERGPEIMKNQRAYVEQLGAVIVPETISRVDFSQWPYKLFTEDNEEINALSVVIATGSAPRVLAVPGEREYWGKGVTTCAVCDAPYYKGKNVIVIGGGDSAIEEAQQLAPYVAQVTIFVRKDELRASDSMKQRLKDVSNISVEFNKEIKKIEGDGEQVTAVEVFDNKTGIISKRLINGVFLAIGHEPRTKTFKDGLKLDSAGYIKMAGRSQKTSKLGIFAAGDVEDPTYRQAGVAAGSGVKAAIEASCFLQEHGWNQSVASMIKGRRFLLEKGGESCIHQLTSIKDFERDVLKSRKPVVLDFYAKHCPACMHMLPVYESVSKRFCDQISFFKVDTASHPELEEKLQVQRIPCFIVYKNGQQVARYYSIMNKPQMIEFVQQFID